MRSILFLCLLWTTFCCSLPAARGELVRNGSFQNPDVPDTRAFEFFVPGQTIGEGWVVDSNSASAVLVSRVAPPTPEDGDQFLILGTAPTVATVWQDVILDVASYRLSFEHGSADLGDDASVSVDVKQIGGGSVLGGPVSFNVAIASGFESQTLDFTNSTSGSYRLIIEGMDGSPAIDAFVLQSITAIPEPSSFALLTILALPAIVRRRRKSSWPW